MPPIAEARPDHLADRSPPFNDEAERGVLGSILLDESTLHDVRGVLRPDDFFRDDLATIYRAMLGLADGGTPINPVSLFESLDRAGRFEAVGGHDQLVAVAESVPHAAHAAYYADIVRQKAISRELIGAADAILRDNYSNQHDAERLIALAQARVFAVGEGRAAGRVVAVGEAAAAAVRRIAQREAGVGIGLSSGFFDLDLMTGPWEPGHLIVLAARPSLGKTAIALNVADFLTGDMDTPVPTLFVSLEMTAEELGGRALVGRSGVDGGRFASANLGDADWAALNRALDRLGPAPLYIADAPAQHLGAIAGLARRYRQRERIGLLAIDYLQLIEPDDSPRGKSRQEVVAEISKGLKNLGKSLGIPVLLLAQLNREVEKRENKKPQLSDLRESGSIEQDADKVLLLHRPEFYDAANEPGVAYVIVAKNRGGPTGEVKLRFHGATTTFSTWGEPLAPDHPLAEGGY